MMREEQMYAEANKKKSVVAPHVLLETKSKTVKNSPLKLTIGLPQRATLETRKKLIKPTA